MWTASVHGDDVYRGILQIAFPENVIFPSLGSCTWRAELPKRDAQNQTNKKAADIENPNGFTQDATADNSLPWNSIGLFIRSSTDYSSSLGPYNSPAMH
jgi:hypothetical protein